MSTINAIKYEELSREELSTLCLKHNLFTEREVESFTKRKMADKLYSHFASQSKKQSQRQATDNRQSTPQSSKKSNKDNTIQQYSASNSSITSTRMQPSTFMSTINQRFDVQEIRLLNHEHMKVFVQHRQDVADSIATIHEIQTEKLVPLISNSCFDQEDLKMLGETNASILLCGTSGIKINDSEIESNPIVQLYIILKSLIETLLEILVMRETAVGRISNNPNQDLRLDQQAIVFFKEKNSIIKQLCNLEQAKINYIVVSVLEGQIKHPVFDQAKIYFERNQDQLVRHYS